MVQRSAAPLRALLVALTLGVSFTLAAAPATADTSPTSTTTLGGTCVELLKECSVYSGETREQCYLAAGQHPLCLDNSLGLLALKRWALLQHLPPAGLTDEPSGDPDAIETAHPEVMAFLGPKLVDPVCVRAFDSQLSAHLVGGSLSLATVESLSQQLDRCERVTEPKLPRP